MNNRILKFRGHSAEAYAQATTALDSIDRLTALACALDVGAVVHGLSVEEQREIRTRVTDLRRWCDGLSAELEKAALLRDRRASGDIPTDTVLGGEVDR